MTNLRFLPTFGETRQFADFLAFLGMQRGRAAYAVTGENLLSPPRLGCHPHSITKSGQEPNLCGKAQNFLLCCRCCQALLHIFSSPHSLGSVSHRPEPSGGFFGAQTSRLQCPSTRADADTINTGCNFPTTEMRETTGDLRWDSVRVHLLCLTVENAIDRATGGKRLDAALPEMVANHASADRARPVWR